MSLPDQNPPGEATPGFGPPSSPAAGPPGQAPGGPFAPPSAAGPAGLFPPPGQPLPGAVPPGGFAPPGGFRPASQPIQGAYGPSGYPAQPAGYPPPGGFPPPGGLPPFGVQPPGYGQPYGPPPGGYSQPTGPYGPVPGAPGFGGYGPAPFASPVPYASPAPYAPPPPLDRLATASFIVSLAGFVTGIGFLVGFVLSIFGLRRIRKTGHSGRGLAMTGLVIGLIGTLITAGIATAVVAIINERNTTAAYATWTSDYRVGNCYAVPFAEAYETQAKPISCDRPHVSEIIAKRNLNYDVSYYDETALQDAAYSYFAGQIDTLVGDPATMSGVVDWYFFLPSQDEWIDNQDGGSLCWVDASLDGLTGSFVAGTSNADEFGLLET